MVWIYHRPCNDIEDKSERFFDFRGKFLREILLEALPKRHLHFVEVLAGYAHAGVRIPQAGQGRNRRCPRERLHRPEVFGPRELYDAAQHEQVAGLRYFRIVFEKLSYLGGRFRELGEHDGDGVRQSGLGACEEVPQCGKPVWNSIMDSPAARARGIPPVLLIPRQVYNGPA